MPSNHRQVIVYVTAAEMPKIAKLLKGATLGNYFRRLAGLPELKRGRPKKGKK